MTPYGRLWNWTLPPRHLNSLGMRLAIACLIPCLNLLQVAPAQDDSQPNPVLVDPAPDQEPDADEVPEEEESAGEELAALEEAAKKAAEEEQVRLAKAATEREAAVGEKHASLTTGKGRTYKKVVIKGVDEVGVKIAHEYGTARIKFEELPEEFQTRFGYDPSRAQEVLSREKDPAFALGRAFVVFGAWRPFSGPGAAAEKIWDERLAQMDPGDGEDDESAGAYHVLFTAGANGFTDHFINEKLMGASPKLLAQLASNMAPKWTKWSFVLSRPPIPFLDRR